jgi:hypothetical protein
MTSTPSRLFVSCWLAIFAAAGCDLVDPMRSARQADTEIFGNLIEAERDPAGGEVWIATIRVGVPRALGAAGDARPTPDVAGGILAAVTVTPDTAVVVGDRFGALDDLRPGSEIVAIPVPGSTSMVGEKEVRFQAAQLMDFASYARWRLPKLTLPGNPEESPDDPELVNSSGVEHSPVPLAGGRVLYFSTRLRPPVTEGGDWIGAHREGLRPPLEGQRSFERSFRTELGDDGWSAPEAVTFPGTEEAEQVQVTWVSGDERRCLATVIEPGSSPWVGTSERSDPGDAWGEISRLQGLGEGDAFDAFFMTLAPEKLVFASERTGNSDLLLFDPAMAQALPLEPKINTGGAEWGSRVGPKNELYFVRDDRQLKFQDRKVVELRLPGPQRTVFIEAAATADRAWLFMSIPRYRPFDFDLDIWVAPVSADGTLGAPVPVDRWRPF